MNRYVRIIKLDLKENIFEGLLALVFAVDSPRIYRNLKEVRESDEGIVYH